jgi:phosphoglycolate phosphatase-like HAD superfamily hydrolase
VLLVLWDIDGTLVHTAGYGGGAFADAFEAVFGHRPAGNVPMPGRTDHEIALAVLERNGVAGGEVHLPQIWEAFADALASKESAIRAEGHAKPGAHEALEALAGRAGVVQSLLTGNIEANAAVKLAAFGLERHLDFEIGAYGSQRGVRADLVRVACERASAKHGVRIGPESAVIVGDTPLDVAAAHRGGARAVAVATGPYGIDELRETGAEAVLPDLRDTEALLAAVGA